MGEIPGFVASESGEVIVADITEPTGVVDDYIVETVCVADGVVGYRIEQGGNKAGSWHFLLLREFIGECHEGRPVEGCR